MKVASLTGLQQGKIGVKVMELAQNKKTGETRNQEANQKNKIKNTYIFKKQNKDFEMDQMVMGSEGWGYNLVFKPN